MRVRRLVIGLGLGASLLLLGQSPASGVVAGHLPDIDIDTVSYNADCDAGTLSITVRVKNLGRTDTGTFAVGLWFNALRQEPRVIGNLAPQRSKAASWTVAYDGGDEVDREHADLRDRVRESDETNNSGSDEDEFCF